MKALILIVCLAGAGVMFYRYFTAEPDSGVNMGETIYWTCRNDACKKDFQTTLGEFAKKKNEIGQVPCTHCGQWKTARAYPCPACGANLELVGHGALPEICTHCNQKIGEESLHETLLKQSPAGKKAAPTRRGGGG